MAETNDTIDGLLAEFRGYSAGMPASYHVTMSWADFRKMLDRFEAAHRRELSKNTSKNGADFGQLGDAAKLRDALENLYDQICHGETEQHVAANRQMIRAALSTPPRNCDLPEVAKDPWRAWLDDKSNWDEFGSPKLEIHDWLFAPATEKEGGAK